PAVQTIQANLELTKLIDKGVIRRGDVFELLQSAAAEPFDFIYIAPPQYNGLWQRALTLLDENPTWTHADTTIIVQIDPSERAEFPLKRLESFDQRRYGNTVLWFFRMIPIRTDEEFDRMELPRLEDIASEFVGEFDIVHPPVPVEDMLQNPKPGMWATGVDMNNMTTSFFSSRGPSTVRMALARFLARQLAGSSWGESHDSKPLLKDENKALLYAFARMIIMPVEMVEAVAPNVRSPMMLAVRFDVPEDDARERLDDMNAL
ncbi:MAG: RsmD family RNA methyltransferase, partial [Anaerolineae bacterium]|nr:RsmD family RNA methyltransferase [Anaerolineae bacterium]